MNRRHFANRQHGYSLVELGLVMILVSTLSGIFLYQQFRWNEEKATEAIGKEAGQVVRAVQSYLSQANGVGVIPAGTTVFNGLDWLRLPADCPGGTSPTVSFVPCFISPNPGLGLSYRTTVVNGGGNVTATIQIASPGPNGPINGRGLPDAELAGIIVSAINGFSDAQFVTANLSTFARATNNPTTGVITVNFAAMGATEIYLRTDGSNTMNNNLRFAGAAGSNNIRGADDVEAQRFVDRNNPVYVIDGNGTSRLNELRVDQRVFARSFVDNDDNAYQVDPNGNSVLWQANVEDLSANRLTVNTGTIGTLSGDTSSFNISNSNTANTNLLRANAALMTSGIAQDFAVFGLNLARDMTDLDDANFFIDPNGISNIFDARIASRGGVRLSQLLSNLVFIDSVQITRSTDRIMKPNCGTSTAGMPLPRLFVRDKANVLRVAQASIDHGQFHQNTATRETAYDWRATDFGAYWTINPWRFDSVTGVFGPSPDGAWEVRAEVACWYP